RRGRRSQHDLRSVGGYLPARFFHDPALFRAAQQRRIRIIDMQKYLPVDSDAGEASDRALVPRHRDMAHALSALAAEPRRDQLVVAPDGAVEEHQRRARKARFQLVGDGGAGGEEVEMLVGRLLADAKAERVTSLVAAAGMGRAFEIPR